MALCNFFIKNDELWIKISLFIFFSLFLISFSKFSFILNGDNLSLDVLVCISVRLGAQSTVGSGVGSEVIFHCVNILFLKLLRTFSLASRKILTLFFKLYFRFFFFSFLFISLNCLNSLLYFLSASSIYNIYKTPVSIFLKNTICHEILLKLCFFLLFNF